MEVGVTGGIGAGKSLVCRVFSILGIPVYDADSRAKILMEQSPDLKRDIQQAFGTSSYDQSGQLNRQYLAELVFADSEKVKHLNSLVHPAVAQDYEIWVNQQQTGCPYVIKEAALLIESGSYRQLDHLISVLAPEQMRIDRVLARDPQRDQQQVESIIKEQVSDTERKQKSDSVLYNDERQPLLQQIMDLHRSLIK